ncbi:MAG: undecaprenyl-diphosphate phosphatase [Bacteroidetes bacterium]|nr:undecaprenyl-diphosphate phosphatase [Bacteroidota bacterium]
MVWWEAVILGLVQGLAEFLPISSSGHLVLGQHILGLSETASGDITFEVFVHFGTALSILTVYGKRVLRILKDLFGAITKPRSIGASIPAGTVDSERGGEEASVRISAYVLLSMIPTGIVYVLFKDQLEAAFSDPRLVCMMLIVTGVLLLLTRLRPNPSGVLSPLKAVVVGIAQAFAMIPGISRSGSTICTAIYMNVDRKEAADFSFLMLLPVIIGATLLKALDMMETGISIDILPLVLGTFVAYASGIFAIRAVVILIQRRSLQYFAFYCFAVGILGLVLIA